MSNHLNISHDRVPCINQHCKCNIKCWAAYTYTVSVTVSRYRPEVMQSCHYRVFSSATIALLMIPAVADAVGFWFKVVPHTNAVNWNQRKPECLDKWLHEDTGWGFHGIWELKLFIVRQNMDVVRCYFIQPFLHFTITESYRNRCEFTIHFFNIYFFSFRLIYGCDHHCIYWVLQCAWHG